MKQILLTILLVVCMTTVLKARTLTAVANGNWETASTWSPAAVPTNNDVVYIPHGKTVSITSNNNDGASYMVLRIAGVLKFVGGGAKLKISSASEVFIYTTGALQTSQNSQLLEVGNNAVASGNNSTQTITGPSVARANTSGFQAYSPAALPVTFVAFTATRRTSDVLVQWSTATESGALGFDVEMSVNGSSWSILANLPAAGNSTTLRQYSFTARNLSTGTIQFRVKQVDMDGKFTYTAIRTVTNATEPRNIQLTASNGRLVLQFSQEVKNVTVRIMNLNGQVLQEQKIAAAIGQVLIPTSQKGYNVVAVLNDDELATSKQVIF
jgi:hypothetical protein